MFSKVIVILSLVTTVSWAGGGYYQPQVTQSYACFNGQVEQFRIFEDEYCERSAINLLETGRRIGYTPFNYSMSSVEQSQRVLIYKNKNNEKDIFALFLPLQAVKGQTEVQGRYGNIQLQCKGVGLQCDY